MNKKFGFVFGISMLVLMLALVSPGVSAATNLDTASLKVTLLNQDPDPAEPGKYVEIRLKAEKFGNNPLTNVNFFLDAEYPFSFDGSDTPDRNIGKITYISGEDWYYTLKYKLKVDPDALEGDYTLKLKYQTNNSDIKGVIEFHVSVADSKNPELVAGSIISNPTKLVSDTDVAQLNIEISNIGDEDAQNVIVKMDFPDKLTPSYSYSDRANLGTIQAGSGKTATFYIDIDKTADSRSYTVPLIISYKEKDDEKNEYKTKTLSIEIPIKEKPNFRINSLTTEPANPSPGDKVKLKLNIENTGKDAESVSIKLYKESSQPITFDEKTDYIGTMDKGQTGTGIITLTIDSDAEPKKYILDMEIRAIDGEQVIVQNETISLTVSPRVARTNNWLGFIVLGVAVVISGIYLIVKSSKKEKKKK